MLDQPLTFEFDHELRLIGVAVADRWADQVAPEDLGFHAVTQYVEQLQRAEAAASAPVEGGRLLPASQAEEIFGGALQIIKEARQLVDEAVPGPMEAPEPTALTDSKRRVTLLADHGMPVAVEINAQWLRRGELDELETALLESFARLPETASAGQDALGELRRRQQALVRQLTELRGK